MDKLENDEGVWVPYWKASSINKILPFIQANKKDASMFVCFFVFVFCHYSIMSDHADDAVGIVHALGWKYGCSTYYHAPRHWKENANNDPFPPQEPEWYDD